MKVSQNKTAYAVVAFVGLGLVGLANCRHHGHRSPEKIDKFVTYILNDVLDDIDASDQQRTSVLESKTRLLNEVMAMRTEGKENHAKLLELWVSDNPDPDQLHALIDEHAAKRLAWAHKAADEALAVNAVLTAQQRLQVSEIIKEKMDRH